jgi:glycosyltransferase involved in cell wall biosynthesis
MRHASRVIFTTQGALQMYAERYPQIPRSRWAVIQNGYDEETFSELEQSRTFLAGGNPCVLLHSGLLYRSERNPTAFFSALAKLRESGRIDPTAVNVVLRDSGDEDYYRKMLKDLNLEEIVLLRPGVPFRDAVAEMLVADGLLIFQASNCNHQIPAKVYEYFLAGRPIFAMTDPKGDTASLLRSSGIGIIVPLDNKERILDGLVHFLELVRQGRDDMPPPHEFEKHSRRQRTKELSALLDSLAV